MNVPTNCEECRATGMYVTLECEGCPNNYNDLPVRIGFEALYSDLVDDLTLIKMLIREALRKKLRKRRGDRGDSC